MDKLAKEGKQKFSFKFVAQSFGDKWKLNDMSTSSIQERLNVLMSRTQNLWNEVTFPLAKPGQTRKPDPENDCGFQVMEDILMIEQTIDRRTPCGVLSLAAVICIEQFSRTGTDITAECVKNRYHIKFQSFLNFLRRGFYALVPTLYIEGYIQAMRDSLYRQEYLRVRVIDNQEIVELSAHKLVSLEAPQM
ncbi:hypothetical protein JHK85_001565 [Glycine max]|nr:hypothetical protein JHK85_001565 [Glycine max]